MDYVGVIERRPSKPLLTHRRVHGQAFFFAQLFVDYLLHRAGHVREKTDESAAQLPQGRSRMKRLVRFVDAALWPASARGPVTVKAVRVT